MHLLSACHDSELLLFIQIHELFDECYVHASASVPCLSSLRVPIPTIPNPTMNTVFLPLLSDSPPLMLAMIAGAKATDGQSSRCIATARYT
jgi:hypothetical protein